MNDGSVFLVVKRKSVAVSCGARPGNTLATFSNPSTVFGAYLSRCISAVIPLMPSPVSVNALSRNDGTARGIRGMTRCIERNACNTHDSDSWSRNLRRFTVSFHDPSNFLIFWYRVNVSKDAKKYDVKYHDARHAYISQSRRAFDRFIFVRFARNEIHECTPDVSVGEQSAACNAFYLQSTRGVVIMRRDSLIRHPRWWSLISGRSFR